MWTLTLTFIMPSTNGTMFCNSFDMTRPGVGCSKLTTSLVNVSLKFKTLILQIHCYFLLEKCENLLQSNKK